jgi:hypothetical protein
MVPGKSDGKPKATTFETLVLKGVFFRDKD